MTPVSFKRCLGVLICAFLLGVLPPASGRADEYLLQPGDVLSVMIFGWTDLEQAVQVEMDGTAWFPIIGEVQVAGATLRQVRERVARAYSLTSFPATGASDVPQLIEPSRVQIRIEEYQPIYISGNLLPPRAVEFRPGLTLRQAIVLAGVDNVGERTATVARERVEAVTLALAQAYGRIWSLKTLLGTDTSQDYENIFVADNDTIEEIVELERSLAAARIEERERQERTLANNIQRAETRLASLLTQKASEEEGLQMDEQIVADLRDLESRGLAPASRLAEVRRAALSSATRVLELDATIEEVRTELAQLQAEAESVEVGARSEAWSDLSEAIALVHDLRAELATLRAAGRTTGLAGERVMAVITRRGEALPPVDIGSADQELQPGDLVEILAISLDESRG